MSPRDWKTWWNDAPAKRARDDVFGQVARTAGGKPTGETDIAMTIGAILNAINPSRDETVLDICCGNGLISSRVAARCGRLIGVDYSIPLIALASQLHPAPNLIYIVCDAAELTAEAIGTDRIDAAYMSVSFQYLDGEMARRLFEGLRRLASGRFRLFLEGVADEDKLFSFYNTPERQAEYYRRRAEGTEAIGNWWGRRSLREVAKSEGFDCTFLEQGP